MYYSAYYPSPVGDLTLACDGEGKALVGLWIAGQKYFGGTLPEAMTPGEDIPLFKTVKNWLDRYFAGETPAISELPLAPIGTAFRQEVWRILQSIPYGQVMTYGGIAAVMAEKMGRKTMSGQAVGGAVGHNPISIIIPCHRVIGADGSLTGFAGGIKTKMQLLKLEGVDMSGMFVPKKGTAL
ncbi:methylated-DNA--[protein]-cysteine S-methyltransferase [Oscillospiraceae bacterium OttesenSCG-928-F05]|nr:methylated-DNA--[protein]-cysteine S-methyltransferase [Oscillospiraceae bacterium OttesenSCG-928-F05]